MRKTLHLLMALFTFAFASAQDFSVGDYGYTIDGDNVKIQGYTGAGGDITIPASVENGGVTYPVTIIGADAFNGNTDIINVVLPTTVTVLEDRAFTNCTALETINCDNIVELGISPLSSLTSLTDYGSFDSLTTMARNSFFKLNSLTSFELPATLTHYDIGVGNTFSSVKTFNIPSTVVHIDNAFFRFVQLTALQANWSIDQLNGTNGETAVNINAKNFIGGADIDHSKITLYVPVGTKAAYEAHAVLGGLNVVEGEIPEIDESLPLVGDTFTDGDYDFTVTSLDPLEAEVSGSALANVVVPATATDSAKSTTYSVTAIGQFAFLGDVVPAAEDAISGININTTLVSVVLPTSVTTIKKSAFTRCQNLESINLENIVTTETDNTFLDCPKLTVANLDSATDIGNFTFHGLGNSTLSTITIPSAVNIGKAAFRTTAISSIDIPASVVTIGDLVFMECNSLTGIQVNWTTAETIPAIVSTVFTNLTTANITLYVPTGTASLYQAAAGWQDLNIVEGSLSAEDIEAGTLNVQVSSDVITVNSTSTFTNGSLTIYDITGRVLISQVLNSTSASVDISNLSSGVYIVKITEGNAKLVKRFVKQ